MNRGCELKEFYDHRHIIATKTIAPGKTATMETVIWAIDIWENCHNMA